MALFKKDIQLMELVGQNSVLYDLTHPKYLDANNKNKVWHSIAKKLMCEVSICRTRWHNIRDQYRKTVKKNNTRASTDSKPIRHYKYSKHLSFLNPFFQQRESKRNDDQEDDITTDDDERILDIEPDILYADVSVSPIDSPTSRPESPPPISPPFCSVSSPVTIPGNFSPQPETLLSESSQKDLPTATFNSLIEYMAKKDQSQHPVDAFLAGVAVTLKNLSPYYQNLAKSDLFAVVQKYEMQMMMENNEIPTGNKRDRTTMKNENESPSDCNDMVQ